MARWRQRCGRRRSGPLDGRSDGGLLARGFPALSGMVFPGEILQAEHQLNWYAEFGEATVRIYLDGRAPPADLQPSYYGYTTGRWEGNTLVTKTIGLRGDTLIDTTGIPHSDQLTVDDADEKGHAGLSSRSPSRSRIRWPSSGRGRPSSAMRARRRITTRRNTRASKATAIGSAPTADVEIVTEKPARRSELIRRQRRPHAAAVRSRNRGRRYEVTQLVVAAASQRPWQRWSAARRRRSHSRRSGLEEIIVTAERRETSLQDTPISVAAFTAETMELKGVETLEDIATFTPNLDIKGSRGSGNVSPDLPDPRLVRRRRGQASGRWPCTSTAFSCRARPART